MNTDYIFRHNAILNYFHLLKFYFFLILLMHLDFSLGNSLCQLTISSYYYQLLTIEDEMEAKISTLLYLNLQIYVYINDLANILAWIISFPQFNYPSSYQRKTISRWTQKCRMGKLLNKMKFHEFKERL